MITHLNLDQLSNLKVVDFAECPADGSFMIRFSDNVLGVEDHTVVCVQMENGVVKNSYCIWEGSYCSDLQFLQTREQLQEALEDDPTGRFPEMYTDIVEL